MSALISISKIIEIAKKNNVPLGSGDPEQHLFYLGKLGLIPRAIKKKVGGIFEGHYPTETVDRLQKISQLKSQGQTYSQMKYMFNSQTLNPIASQPTQNFVAYSQHIFASSPVAFLIIGLVLGYVVTVQNFRNSAPFNAATTQEATSQTYVAQTSALTPEEKNFINIVSPEKDTEQTIYVITGPKNSFTKLGKTQINLQ